MAGRCILRRCFGDGEREPFALAPAVAGRVAAASLAPESAGLSASAGVGRCSHAPSCSHDEPSGEPCSPRLGNCAGVAKHR